VLGFLIVMIAHTRDRSNIRCHVASPGSATRRSDLMCEVPQIGKVLRVVAG
jgi:hypothetical protein